MVVAEQKSSGSAVGSWMVEAGFMGPFSFCHELAASWKLRQRLVNGHFYRGDFGKLFGSLCRQAIACV